MIGKKSIRDGIQRRPFQRGGALFYFIDWSAHFSSTTEETEWYKHRISKSGNKLLFFQVLIQNGPEKKESHPCKAKLEIDWCDEQF